MRLPCDRCTQSRGPARAIRRDHHRVTTSTRTGAGGGRCAWNLWRKSRVYLRQTTRPERLHLIKVSSSESRFVVHGRSGSRSSTQQLFWRAIELRNDGRRERPASQVGTLRWHGRHPRRKRIVNREDVHRSWGERGEIHVRASTLQDKFVIAGFRRVDGRSAAHSAHGVSVSVFRMTIRSGCGA